MGAHVDPQGVGEPGRHQGRKDMNQDMNNPNIDDLLGVASDKHDTLCRHLVSHLVHFGSVLKAVEPNRELDQLRVHHIRVLGEPFHEEGVGKCLSQQ